MSFLKSIRLVCDKKCIKENLLKYKVIFANKSTKKPHKHNMHITLQ